MDPFGTATGTGPLAGLGVLLLHAVCGLVLGTVYGFTQGHGTPGGMESRHAMVSTRVAWRLTLGAMIDVATSLALTGIYLAFATPTFLKPTDPMPT